MAQKLLQAQYIGGQARNPTVGQVDKELLPDRVYNLVPDRMGGYLPFGRRTALLDDEGDQIVLDPADTIIGIDESGITSFRSPSDHLKLYRGRRVDQSDAAYPDGPDVVGWADDAVHLDTAGAYLDRNRFLVLSRELGGERIPVQPLVGATATATAGAGSPLSNGELPSGMGGPVEVEFGGGVFVVITAYGIWRRSESGTWTQTYNESDTSRGAFQRLRYGNGVWLAAQSGWFDEVSRIYRSTDGGQTWTPTALGPVGRVTFIERGPADSWMLGMRNLSQSVVVRSQDGGQTWPNTEARSDNTGLTDGQYFSDRDVFVISTNGTANADVFIAHPPNNFWQALWDWAFSGWATTPGDYRTHPEARRVVRTRTGRMVVLSWDGRVSYTQGPITEEAQDGTNAAFQRISAMSAESGGTVMAYDLAYDPIGNVLIAVGVFSPTGGTPEPRAWRSTDEGVSWARMNDVEAAFTSTILTVAVDDEGNALYMANEGWAFSGTTRGLEGGEYNVYVISYFNTHAGKFAYDLSVTTLTTEDGGSIHFSAPLQSEIEANNPWIGAGGWQAILEDLRFDVYIQAVREPIAGEDLNYTIRYAFTESFPTPTSPLTRELDELPLGRQLLLHGEPTTAVFEKRHTALHNGRIWGLAVQDEERWPNDVASPEIANQHQRFVLSYTEVGWANLISDRSWIVIQPTQSTQFTGILSTPSGLLVMFENEIYLVTGDPAFGNVSVELYLDMVGHDMPIDGMTPADPGPRPCKVGGVPFVIWNGKVWVLQAGQAQQLAPDQWRRDDPFVRISPEPQTRSLLALTETGLVFRYILDDQFWLTDPMTRAGVDDGVQEFLTNCACLSGDNTRFMLGDGSLWSTRQDGTPDSPHIYYRSMDFGEPQKRHALYMVKFGVENYQRNTDRADDQFDPAVLPVLYFEADRADNTLSEGLPSIGVAEPMPWGGRLPYSLARVRADGGAYSWRLPLAATKSSGIDVRLELRNMGYTDVFRLPIQFFYASGGESR